MNLEKARQLRAQARGNAPVRFNPKDLIGAHPLVITGIKEEKRFYKYTQCYEWFHFIKLRPVNQNIKFGYSYNVREAWTEDSKFLSLLEEFELDVNEDGELDLSVLIGETVLAEIEEYQDGERTYFNVVNISKYSPEVAA